MRIFLISNMYPSSTDPDYGVFVKNIEHNLKEKGAKISCKSVISGRKKSVPLKIWTYIVFYFSIINHYRKENFDIVYLHFLSHSAPGLWLAKLFFSKKKKIVINTHGSDVLNYQKGVLYYFSEKILQFTDLIIVPSAYLKETTRKKFPFLSKEKLYVSPSGGIDTSIFYPISSTENNKFTIGFVSRIENEKGWKTFIKALKQFKNNRVDFHAYIAGQGSKANEMQDLIATLNLDNQVEYLGVLNQPDLNKLYNKLSIFVFPSFSESLGLVGLEAMACKVPIIGSEIAGLKTFVENRKNGLFFTLGNENELYKKLMEFYNYKEETQIKMKEEAYKTALQFDKNSITEALYNKFIQLIDNSI